MNFDTAAEEFNSQTEELRDLFEAVCNANLADVAVGTASPGTAVRIPANSLTPSCWGDFLKGIQSHTDTLSRAKGKVRDTQILHRLYRLATVGNAKMAGSSLAACTSFYLGLELDKEGEDDELARGCFASNI